MAIIANDRVYRIGTGIHSSEGILVDRDGEIVLDMAVVQALQLARAIDSVVSTAAAIELL